MMNIDEEDVNLGFAFGSPRYSIHTSLNICSGAGVNAKSRVEDMAFAASDPLSELVWSPNDGLILKCTNSRLADKKPVLLWNVGPTSQDLSPSLSIRSKGSEDGKENALDRGNWTTNDMIIDKGTLVGPPGSFLTPEKTNDVMDLDVAKPKPLATNLSETSVCSLPNFRFQKEADHKVISATPLKKLESSVENALYQEKGKENDLSDGDAYDRSANNEDDGQESVESRNCAELFSRGTKRQSNDHGLILRSKRMKRQVDENLGLTSTMQPDSSFKNWISNMVKGLGDSNKDNTSSLAVTLARSNDVYGKKMQEPESINMGFQSMFQSLYCRNTKENDLIEKSRELVAEKTSHESLTESRDGSNDDSCKQIVVANEEVNPITVDCSPYACEMNLAENGAKDRVSRSDSSGKQMDSSPPKVTQKINPLTSSWITRLSTRTHMADKNDKPTHETNVGSTFGRKVNRDTLVNDVLPVDQNSSEAKDAYCPIVDPAILPSQKFQSSEAMASVFARRLDALRHIIPSEKRNFPTCLVTCFFCGSNHDLRDCPNVTETELEVLVLKMSSFEKVYESPCLCIRCFQLDHWAISCPHVKGCETFPLCSSVTAQNKVAPSLEILLAIRNLRLSRADILRWMNSDVSLSHLNGFFLRLRLGKFEAGMGAASYYVACITGDAREADGCRSKKSILVDVGGIKSSVGSQYVSNHDFLEDEIKTWWCTIVKNGCNIPSLVELNSKFNDKKSLGF